MPHKFVTGRRRWFFFRAMWGLPFTVTCPSADVTVRCWTARLHPLSARNLETNVTDSVAQRSFAEDNNNNGLCYISKFVSLLRRSRLCIFASFLLRPVCPVMFQQSSACPVCHRQTGQSVLSVRYRRTGRLAIFTVPSCFRETGHAQKLPPIRQYLCLLCLPWQTARLNLPSKMVGTQE